MPFDTIITIGHLLSYPIILVLAYLSFLIGRMVEQVSVLDKRLGRMEKELFQHLNMKGES